jgi:3-hydroxymyristoyl/3-hydroxydecanoyl-(acyl carrier protein) dehydratase
MSTETNHLDIHKILTLLPHRYPFLLVDRVLELQPHKRIKALKNVSINEPYFTGHFPTRPVMPGVLVLESLAQAAALLTFSEEPHAVSVRRNRRCALQAGGRAGRSTHLDGLVQAPYAWGLEVHRTR